MNGQSSGAGISQDTARFLLEALEELVQAVDPQDQATKDGLEHYYNGVVRKANRAIKQAKAEGRQ